MRILHVDPARTWRGGERQVFLLARELTRRGHESPVVAHPGSPLAIRCGAAGLSVFPLAMRADLDLLAVWKLVRLLSANRPDILHLHTARAHAVGGLAARWANVHPVLVTRRLELPVRGPFGRWKYRALADHFVAISEDVARSLRKTGVPPERISSIPSGVELPKGEPRMASDASKRLRVVGTLAAFTDQKDPATWLAVALRLLRARQDLEFVWWGEGPFRRTLQESAARENLGTRIDLSGFHEDLEEFWRRVDVFFLPSRFEALGTVLLDAMARGVPVVASDVGGIPEVVRDGIEGELVVPGDVEGFMAKISRALDDSAWARRLGDAGRVRAREFAIDRVVDRIESLYNALRLSGHSPSFAGER